jgi:hypothetical protein
VIVDTEILLSAIRLVNCIESLEEEEIARKGSSQARNCSRVLIWCRFGVGAGGILPSPSGLGDDNRFSGIGSHNSSNLVLYVCPCARCGCVCTEEGMAIGSAVVARSTKSWIACKGAASVDCDDATGKDTTQSRTCGSNSSRDNRNRSTTCADKLVANADSIYHIQVGTRLIDDFLDGTCDVDGWVTYTYENFHTTLSCLSCHKADLIAVRAVDSDNAIACHSVEVFFNREGVLTPTLVVDDIIADTKATELASASIAALLGAAVIWSGGNTLGT